ncbi:MAG: hypothetical protein M1824_004187 [Vezdaea acicularis]|nr:MAG: hypothetical protein M1824_004187 [Vezdaea acicularis]
MAPPSRPRQVPNPWNRMKAAPQDPLESAGLPSKGDTKLLDHKAQEAYYQLIQGRWLSLCGTQGGPESLHTLLSTLSLSPSPSSSAPALTFPPREISLLSLSLRKLREATLSTHRQDTFTTTVYTFSIRFGILTHQPASYSSALLHLLYTLHPHTPLPGPLLREFVIYLILDLASRRSLLGEAYAVRHRFGVHDVRVDILLAAMTQGDYRRFFKALRGVDGYQRALLGEAEGWMVRRALKCVGRGYLGVGVGWLEGVTGGRSWDVLVGEFGVGWEREGERVLVRRVRARG